MNEYKDPYDRIIAVMKYADIPNANVFATELGLKRSENLYQIKRGTYGISKNLAAMIVRKYPAFSYDWLINGGTLILNPVSRQYDGIRSVPLYLSPPYDGRQPDDYLFLSKKICYGAELAVYYAETCLQPLLTPGSIVLMRSTSDFLYGSIYLIQWNEFLVFRIVRKSKDGSKITLSNLSADKETFNEFELNKSNIKSFYLVCGMIYKM